MVDFFKGLSFFILPLGLGSKRLEFFEKRIKEFFGTVGKKSKPTHVIVDESVGENREKCLMALKTLGILVNDDVKFVGTKWLSKCFAEKKLVDVRSYEFDWMEKEPSRTEQDDGNNNKRKRKDGECSGGSGGSTKTSRIDTEEYPCSGSSIPQRDESQKTKELIIDELQKLADAFAARNDTWRAYSYGNAVSAIARYDKDITTYQEACRIPGIGEKMALKIMEILECGKLGKVEDILDEKTKILGCFCNIWGVGPSTAEIWYRQGCRSLDDLKGKVKLNKQQEIGLKFYNDFMKRIAREEVKKIGEIVSEELKHVHGHCWTELVGSYRRGKATCGDVDVMVVNPGPKHPRDILINLTDRLRRQGYLTDDLVTLEESSTDESNHRKYMGVFAFPNGGIHRRIDIFVVPKAEYAAGLMHYTGSAMYNRSIRLLAARKGMTLNEHGLYTGIVRKGSDILNEGELVPTPTEKDIFECLGLEFKTPEERNL